jgi:REP element-mobilizing transposase RayT
VQTLRPAQEWQPLRLLAYVVMPNHWHLVLWPEHDGDWSPAGKLPFHQVNFLFGSFQQLLHCWVLPKSAGLIE